MMEQAAGASLERAESAHAAASGAARTVESHAESARLEERAATRLTAFILLVGPAVAVASAAALTLGDESLRAPAIAAFLISLGGTATAHRAWEARCAAGGTTTQTPRR
jgi:hypothetical protein